MYPTYSFQVDLLNRTSIYGNSQPDSLLSNITSQLEFATVYIEGVDHALKHGDIFTVSGQKAIRIKALADSGQLSFTLETV